MPQDRDLFANFERMRREMDELFGDVFDRRVAPRRGRLRRPPSTCTTWATRRGRSCAPTWRASTPTRSGSRCAAASWSWPARRPPEPGADRVYQQLEIEHGPFRRVVALGADVDADAASAAYEDGMLIVELPLQPPKRPRTVPIDAGSTGGER